MPSSPGTACSPAPQQLGPLLTGSAVSLAWAVTATAMAYLLFVRRDFTSMANDGSMRRVITFGVLPLAGVLAVSAWVLAGVTGSTGSGLEQDKVQRSLATAFAHLYRLQSSELYHLKSPRLRLRVTASCTKGGVMSSPGRARKRLALHHLLASPWRQPRDRTGHLPA